MANLLDGRIAIVTGAGSGMGRATALALLAHGAKVVAGDVSERGLQLLPQRDDLVITPCDVSNPDSVRDLVDAAVEVYGGLNIVCAAAGICETESVEDASSVWERTLAVNLNGVMYTNKFAIPAMKKSGGGSIVNWASTSAVRGSADLLSAYSASKAAVDMFTKCVAIEHAADGIRANTVCPGWIDTPMIADLLAEYGSEEAIQAAVRQVQPLGLGTPEAVADAAVYLASDASRLITGSALMVDGGLTALESRPRPTH